MPALALLLAPLGLALALGGCAAAPDGIRRGPKGHPQSSAASPYIAPIGNGNVSPYLGVERRGP